MELFLWIGSALGAVFGLLHGVYLYREITAAATKGATAINVRALYHGGWTFVLWTVFGSYVLALWLVGLIGSSIVRLMQRQRSV